MTATRVKREISDATCFGTKNFLLFYPAMTFWVRAPTTRRLHGRVHWRGPPGDVAS